MLIGPRLRVAQRSSAVCAAKQPCSHAAMQRCSAERGQQATEQRPTSGICMKLRLSASLVIYSPPSSRLRAELNNELRFRWNQIGFSSHARVSHIISNWILHFIYKESHNHRQPEDLVGQVLRLLSTSSNYYIFIYLFIGKPTTYSN